MEPFDALSVVTVPDQRKVRGMVWQVRAATFEAPVANKH